LEEHIASIFTAGFLLGLFFDPEDGDDFQRITRRYITEGRTIRINRSVDKYYIFQLKK
jgi:hypothetical protein